VFARTSVEAAFPPVANAGSAAGQPASVHHAGMEAVVFIGMSVDGYIARPDGGLDWLSPFEGEEHGYAEFFASVDALVIGRGTYQTVLGFPQWPYGDKRVVVCTSRKLTAAHGEEFWPGEVRALYDELAAEGTRRVYVDGGALIRSFLKAGLVDQMTLTFVPIVLGSGIPLFATGLPESPLRLVASRTFPSGLVQASYRVER
jgi:dihydrofolate reductase